MVNLLRRNMVRATGFSSQWKNTGNRDNHAEAAQKRKLLPEEETGREMSVKSWDRRAHITPET